MLYNYNYRLFVNSRIMELFKKIYIFFNYDIILRKNQQYIVV